jgi:hypothetical protein
LKNSSPVSNRSSIANVVDEDASSSYATAIVAFVVPLVSKFVVVTHGSAISQYKDESLYGHCGNE